MPRPVEDDVAAGQAQQASMRWDARANDGRSYVQLQSQQGAPAVNPTSDAKTEQLIQITSSMDASLRQLASGGQPVTVDVRVNGDTGQAQSAISGAR